MSEFIVIQVGQCGNQIGSQFWKLALAECGFTGRHEMDSLSPTSFSRTANNCTYLADEVLNDCCNSFFWSNDHFRTFNGLTDLISNKIKAKAILIDMEDGVISRIMTSKTGGLFDEGLKLTHYAGSGNNWAVGHKVHGKNFHEKLLSIIHLAVKKCESLQGFIILCSLGGGTGSGLGTYVLKILEEEFSDIERFVGCIYPDKNDDVITSPYNVMLSSEVLASHATCVFPFDNEALLNICYKSSLSGVKNCSSSTSLLPTESPMARKSFQDMNSVIVNMLLHLTSSSRFPGALNLDINEVYTNMVPFPKMHYISSGLSPLGAQNPLISRRQDELFYSCWSRDNQLCRSIDPINSTLLAVSFIGRGFITMAEMRKNVDKLQSRATFAPWASESVKVGLCTIPSREIPASLLCLYNSTGINNLLSDNLKKFSKLYSRKAHLHHYLVEGIEVCDIEECISTMQDVISDYKSVNSATPENILPQLKIY